MKSLRPFALMILLLAPAAAGQLNLRTFDHEATGVRFRYPKDFRAVPMQPTEKLIIARMSRSKPFRATKKNARGRRPEAFSVFALEARTTPKDGEEKETVVRTFEDAARKRNEIYDVRSFMKSRWGNLELRRYKGKGADKDADEYTLHPRRAGARKGYLYVKRAGGMTLGVVGFADAKVFDAMMRRFRVIGKSLEKPKGTNRVRDRSSDFYRGKDYRDIPFRVEARKNMVKGWKAHDTENFFIVYHTKNEKLINKIANDLEATRPLYMKYFPPVKPIETVSVVRVCRDLTEYHKYGGRPGTGGYWNFVARELVLFDYSKTKTGRNNRARTNKDSYIVLYHEAFHQYIFYAVGEIAPHDWFNEGLGDFFSGTVVYARSKRVKEVGPNKWRIPVVKKAVGTQNFTPLHDLFHAERPQYYNPRRASYMYAQGWALCYFLLESKVTDKRPEWRGIIERYFNQLKESRNKHMGLLGKDAKLGERLAAQKKARDEALKAALEQVDVEELEAAWIDWIKKMKDPWAASRRKR